MSMIDLWLKSGIQHGTFRCRSSCRERERRGMTIYSSGRGRSHTVPASELVSYIVSHSLPAARAVYQASLHTRRRPI